MIEIKPHINSRVLLENNRLTIETENTLLKLPVYGKLGYEKRKLTPVIHVKDSRGIVRLSFFKFCSNSTEFYDLLVTSIEKMPLPKLTAENGSEKTIAFAFQVALRCGWMTPISVVQWVDTFIDSENTPNLIWIEIAMSGSDINALIELLGNLPGEPDRRIAGKLVLGALHEYLFDQKDFDPSSLAILVDLIEEHDILLGEDSARIIKNSYYDYAGCVEYSEEIDNTKLEEFESDILLTIKAEGVSL